MREGQSKWTWVYTILLVGFIAAVGGAVWHWREQVSAVSSSQERVQEWIASLGPWGPLVGIGLNMAQVLLAPIPGQFVGLMNGYLYGVGLGTLYSMVGLLLGSTLAMVLARRFGRPLAERLVDAETLARWDRITNRQGPLFFFLIYLIPGLPDDIVCFLIGLSPLPIARMVVLAMIGRLPGVLVSCWFGAHTTELPLWAWIALGAGTCGIAWVFWRCGAQFETAMVGLIEKLTGRRRPGAEPEDSAAEEGYPASP